MALRTDTKTTFEPSRVIEPIYSGGAVSLSQNGRILVSTLGEEVRLTDLETGSVLARIEGDGEPVTTLSLTPNARYLIVCSRSLSMRIFSIEQFEDNGLSLETKLLRTLRPHTAPVVTCTTDASGSLLATGGADGVVKVWDLRGGYATHTFHGHSGLISALHFFQVENRQDLEQKSKSRKRKSRQHNDDEEEELNDASAVSFRLASGGEDGKVKIWDLHKRKSVATLDSHVSIVRSLDYSPDLKMLLSASRDKTVVIWDSRTWDTASTVPVLEAVESAAFVENGKYFYTGGETGTLKIWETTTGSEVTSQYCEENEAILDILYFPNQDYLITIHADQTLVMRSLELLRRLQPSGTRQMPELMIQHRISGTHDEIIDFAYVGSNRQILALATNIEDIRLISLAPESSPLSPPYFGADITLLQGHKDIIITLSVDWSGHWLATGAKDNTARLWRLDPMRNEYTCYSIFSGHAESIGAVALPSAVPPASSKEFIAPLSHPPKFLITGSQDKTVKRWEIPTAEGKPRASYTRKAHDKDINAIATSYSYELPLFASASQDRTVKIWDTEAGEAIGVLRGHKRGVWSVAFSPPDMPALTTSSANGGGGASSSKGMIVTGSGDKTVRIWSLSDYSCLRTFEGHANSVLKVVWLPPPTKGGKESTRGRRGIQVASAAGDGLVKVWDAQEGECAATLDNHIDRVWALTVKPKSIHELNASRSRNNKVDDGGDINMDDADAEEVEEPDSSLTLISGSADATITFWTDTTATTAAQTSAKASARVEQDQELQNHIRAKNYREAIVLALQLNHPRRLLDIFTEVVNKQPSDEGSLTGSKDVDEVIQSLSNSQLFLLMKRLRDWNANARTSSVAQRILWAVLRLVGKERVLILGKRKRETAIGDVEMDNMESGEVKDASNFNGKEGIKDVLDGLKAYTQKHLDRIEKSSEERFVLTWALEQMDGGVGDGGRNGIKT